MTDGCDKHRVCNKHDGTMSRIFDKMQETENFVARIDTKMDAMIEFKDLLHEVVFGNGKPGIKGNVDSVKSQVVKMWGIMIVILTAIFTAVTVHLMNGG